MEIVELATGRAALRGTQERVPHLHLKLGGWVFAALYVVAAAVISADRRRLASVTEIRLRPHIRPTCADELIEAIRLLLIGQQVVSSFGSKFTGRRIKILTGVEDAECVLNSLGRYASVFSPTSSDNVCKEQRFALAWVRVSIPLPWPHLLRAVCFLACISSFMVLFHPIPVVQTLRLD